jgi:hypothetical protein
MARQEGAGALDKLSESVDSEETLRQWGGNEKGDRMQKHFMAVALGIAAGLAVGGAGGYFLGASRADAGCEELRRLFGDPVAEKKRYEAWRKEFEENRRRQDEAAKNIWKAK